MEQREQFINELNDYLEDSLHTDFEEATPEQIYKALARIVNGQLKHRYFEFKRKKNKTETTTAG
jgi:starch phosphorylase